MPLDAQERRGACSLQAFGPDPGEATLETLTTELADWNGPNFSERYRFTGPEQGLMRNGQAAPDVIDTQPGASGACSACGWQNPATAYFCGRCAAPGLGCNPPLERDRWQDWTIVSLSVLANAATGRTAPATTQQNSFDPATLTTVPFLKARITSPQWKGPVWIDCDRTIVIPSPRACVTIVGPSTWFDAAQPRPVSVEDITWNAWIFAKVCRAFCCPTGLPILTEFFTLAIDEVRLIPRRRGARRIWFSSQPVLQQWELISGILPVGSILIPANSFIAVDLAPGITGIRNVALAAARNVVLTWEIQP